MDDAHGGPYAREPQIEDLVRICLALNDAGARYILIGGFAVIAHGGGRTTTDIDLLIDASPENVTRVKQALQILEDHAVTHSGLRMLPIGIISRSCYAPNETNPGIAADEARGRVSGTPRAPADRFSTGAIQ